MDTPSKKKRKRQRHTIIEGLPLCSYTSHSWFCKFQKMHKDIVGEDLVDVHGERHKIALWSSLIARDVYSKVFYNSDHNWSAENLVSFFEEGLEKTKDSSRVFSLSFFKNDNFDEFRRTLVDEATEEFSLERDADPFKRMTHLKFYSLVSAENDFSLIFDQMDEEDLPRFLHNYGIPIYARYVFKKERESGSFTVEEANYLTKKRIFNFYNDAYQKDRPLAKKFFESFFKESILWEPYVPAAKSMKENDVFKWREIFAPIIERHSFKEADWWKEGLENSLLPQIVAVRNFFQ